jgi:hypothetical protein
VGAWGGEGGGESEKQMQRQGGSDERPGHNGCQQPIHLLHVLLQPLHRPLRAQLAEIALAAGVHRPVHRQVDVVGNRRGGGIEPVFRPQCSMVVIDPTITKKKSRMNRK